MSQRVEKVQRGGKGQRSAKSQKAHNSKCGHFDKRGGGGVRIKKKIVENKNINVHCTIKHKEFMCFYFAQL